MRTYKNLILKREKNAVFVVIVVMFSNTKTKNDDTRNVFYSAHAADECHRIIQNQRLCVIKANARNKQKS